MIDIRGTCAAAYLGAADEVLRLASDELGAVPGFSDAMGEVARLRSAIRAIRASLTVKWADCIGCDRAT